MGVTAARRRVGPPVTSFLASVIVVTGVGLGAVSSFAASAAGVTGQLGDRAAPATSSRLQATTTTYSIRVVGGGIIVYVRTAVSTTGKVLNVGQMSVRLVDTRDGATLATWTSNPSPSARSGVRDLLWGLSAISPTTNVTVLTLDAPVGGVVWHGPEKVSVLNAVRDAAIQAWFGGSAPYAASKSRLITTEL